MSDEDYYYPDVFCEKCQTKRHIALINKLVKCSNCGTILGWAKKK